MWVLEAFIHSFLTTYFSAISLREQVHWYTLREMESCLVEQGQQQHEIVL